MKTRRHAKILEIINNTAVETQEDLQELLRQAGFSVTQATVSRDIKELRLIKSPMRGGGYRYTTAKGGHEPISASDMWLDGHFVRGMNEIDMKIVADLFPT